MVSAIRLALIVVYTLICGSAACLVSLVDRTGETAVRIGRLWIAWILPTCGVRVEAEGLEHVPRDQPVVFMSNHQSHFDVAAIIHTLPVSWRFVAKRELTRVPFFGWALVTGGHVVIDRSNRASAVRSLQHAATRLRAGTNVIIFPEGTRSPTGELQPFKSGGFHLAVEAGVPIVPVSVEGTQWITPKKSLRIEGGRVHVVYGEPISTAAHAADDLGPLKEEVRRAIAAGLELARTRT